MTELLCSTCKAPYGTVTPGCAGCVHDGYFHAVDRPATSLKDALDALWHKDVTLELIDKVADGTLSIPKNFGLTYAHAALEAQVAYQTELLKFRCGAARIYHAPDARWEVCQLGTGHEGDHEFK